MVSGFGMSAIVPFRRAAIRRPLPSTGSRRVGSPASTVVRGAPTPCRPSRRTSLPSLGGTALCARLSLPPATERSHRRPGALCNRRPLVPVQRAETAGPRRFLGNPIADMPCSSTPVGPRRQAISAPRCCLPPFVTTSAPTMCTLTGLNHTACPLAVYASSSQLPATTQDSLLGCWPALPGGIGHPLGSSARFQSSLHLILLAQALPVAPRNSCQTHDSRSPTDGVRYSFSSPSLGFNFVLMAFIGTFAYNWGLVLLLLARYALDAGPEGFGALNIAMGLGSVLGGLLLATRLRPSARLVAISAGVYSLLVGLIGLAPSMGVVLGMLLVAGVVSIVYSATSNTLLQLEAREEYCGRVLALYMLLFAGSTPIGSAVTGLLSDRWDIRVAL